MTDRVTRDDARLASGTTRPPSGTRPPDPERAYITDPRAMRVLAHAGRLAIFSRLQSDGPATATECAKVCGMSPNAAAYHLHQLARYGFVAEAPGRGDLRERVWEAKVRGFRIDDEEFPDAETVEAETTLMRAHVQAADLLFERWLQALADEPFSWRAASMLGTKELRVNAAELGALFEQLAAAIQPYLANRRPAEETPPDARLVHVDLRMFPWTDPPPQFAIEAPADPAPPAPEWRRGSEAGADEVPDDVRER